MNYLLSENEAKDISVCLHNIYEAVVFDGKVLISDYKITTIAVEVVELQNEADKAFFAEHKGVSFAYDSSEELAARFLAKTEDIFDDVGKAMAKISTAYSNVSDVLAITVPYVLLKFGVGNQEVGLFVGLGILISQIVIQHIAEKHDKKTQVSKADLLKLIEVNKAFLEKIEMSELPAPLSEYKNELTALSTELDNNSK
jgi:hypothetical protein